VPERPEVDLAAPCSFKLGHAFFLEKLPSFQTTTVRRCQASLRLLAPFRHLSVGA
jgi:hypothetical protein